MTQRLSDLTWSTLEFRINEVADPSKKDHATSRLLRQAGIAVGTRCDDRVMVRIERWLADTSHETYVRALEDIGTHKRCDLRLVSLARDRGVNAAALAITAWAIGGPAGIDVGTREYDTRQISARQEGVFDEIMIPLDVDVYWTGRHLLVRQGMLAHTMMTAAAGRPAGDLVAHPALADAGRVVAVEEDTGIGGFDILMLEERLTPWRETVAELFHGEGAKAA